MKPAFGEAKKQTRVSSRPDETSAAVSARAQGSPVEVESLRSETSQTFANPDGTMTTKATSAPTRFKDDQGAWKNIDLTLVEQSDGTVAPKSVKNEITLGAGDASASGGSARVTADQGVDALEVKPDVNTSVVFGWPKKLPKPKLKGSEATYANADSGVDYRVQALRRGMETFVDVKDAKTVERLIAKNGPAKGRLAVEFPVKLDGVSAKKEADGSVSFVDGDGKVVSHVAAPGAWDAKVIEKAGIPASTTDTRLDVTSKGKNKAIITVSVDAGWARSGARQFPITIDPTYASGSINASFDTWVQSDSSSDHSTDSELRAGTFNGGATVARSYLNFPLAGLAGKQVVSASLSLYSTWSWSCTPSRLDVGRSAAASSATRWTSQPNVYASGGSASFAKGANASTCPAGRQAIDVTQAVKDFTSSGWSNGSLALQANNEKDSNGWKRFASSETSNPPQLTYTYNRAPNVAAAPSFVANGTYGSVGYVQGGKVTFSSVITDPDASRVKATFEIHNSTTTSSSSLVASCTSGLGASGAKVSCANATDLPDGGTYYVRAKASDELGLSNSSWSGWTTIKRAGTAPAAPSISCPNYANGSWAQTGPSADVSCTVSTSGSGVRAATRLDIYVDGAATPTKTIDAKQTATSTTVTVPKANGAHSVRAVAVGGSNLSASTTSSFGWGKATVSSPVNGASTSGKVRVTAAGQGSSTPTAKVQWRVTGTSSTSAEWVDGPSLPVTVSSGVAKADGTFDTATATTRKDGSSLNPRVPVTLDVQVCFTYPGNSTPQCTWDGTAERITRLPHAFGSTFPTQDTGFGQVAQVTGELNVDGSDASVPGLAGDLTLSRSHLSFAGDGTLNGWPTTIADQVFGPGFSANLDGPDAGLGGMSVIDQTATDGTMILADTDGSVLVFGQPGGGRTKDLAGTYEPITQDTVDSGLKLVVATGGTSMTVTEDDKTVTTYTLTNGQWGVSKVAEPGTAGTTTYTRDGTGRVTRILSGLPDGFTSADCPGTGALTKKGCRALDITYGASTGNGDVTGQVKSASAYLWDPASNAMKSTPVATYTYDSNKRLVKVTDPRSNLSTSYTWDGDSTRLASIAPSGQAAFRITYDGDKKVKQITRDAATTGGNSAALYSFVYGVPATGNSSLPSLGATDVAKWAQASVPATGYAVFGQDHPVSSTNASNISAGDWSYASLSYVDANNYEVNSAEYGAGQWLVSSSDYDAQGNPIRTLTPQGIKAALDATPDGADAAEVKSTSDFYATSTIYNDDIKDASGTVTLPAGSRVVDVFTPASQMSVGGALVTARKKVHTDYDQGAPNSGVNPATGQPYSLATTVTASVIDNAGTQLSELSKTTNGYAAISSGDTDGWSLGMPTTVTTGGVTRTTRYDSAGRTIEERQPKATSTASAGTRRTVFYTAGTNSDDAQCGNKPEWAGSPCRVFPGTAPSSGPSLPDARTTGMDMWLNPTTVVEASGSANRTTTTRYDAAARPVLVKATGSIPGATAIPATFTHYNTVGLVDYTGDANDAGTDATSNRISTGYDNWGRKTSYTNESGESATTTYGVDGAVASVSDPKGTTAYTYDGTDAAGKTERRGLVTGMSVTRPGTGGDLTYGAAFDIDGKIMQEDMPGFVTARTDTNTLGEVTGLSYEGQVTPVTATTADDGTVSWTPGTPTTGTWMAWTQERDGLGRVARQYTGAGAAFDGDPGIAEDGDTSHMSVGTGKAYDKEYSYDGLSRLTKVTDREKAAGAGAIDPDTKVSADAACAARTYTFDANGNRTASNETTHADGDCAGTANTTSTSATMAYDDADRPTTGKNGAGSYTYDAFGRQTLMPKADAPNPGAGDVTLGYYLDDSIQKISQGGTVTTFTLDSAGRRKAQTSTPSSGAATTLTRHYTDDSDNPSWVELSGGGLERYTDSVSGSLGAMLDETGKANIALIDPNGNTATSLEIAAVNGTNTPATSITDWSTYSEYGQPTTGGTTGTNASSGVLGYGWLGAHQRATTPDTAGLTLMGARVYNNQRGLFTSLDPVYGGNETSYAYPNDPLNLRDTTGLHRSVEGGGFVAPGRAGQYGQRGSAPRAYKPPKNAIAKPKKTRKSLLRREYFIYEIQFLGGGFWRTWKYGISGVSWKRAQNQIYACQAWGRTICKWRKKGIRYSYYEARTVEMTLIAKYYYRNGKCPPGHKTGSSKGCS
ncbi:DNRLRE domain-containing protein [Dermacoccus abyssi]|uniref:DNRLRE domain-containing protein n=1 Tax=Dermacoccus abyssi TaxID=322596 RepID=UPI0015F8AAA1|nr:DNRLRE domain-containing protein [Dermacoccus abyssi]